MAAEAQEDILGFLKSQISENEKSVKNLSPSKLKQAWKLAKELTAVFKTPDTEPSCNSKRKRGRPRKIKNQDTDDACTYTSPITESSRIPSVAPNIEAHSRPKRKASSRFQELLNAVKKDTRPDSEDEADTLTSKPANDTILEMHKDVDSEIENVENDDKILVEETPGTTMFNQGSCTEIQITEDNTMVVNFVTTNETEASNEKVENSEKIPTRGPTKLSQEELAFYERCRMADGLGWKCPTCQKILNNRANLLVHMRIHTGEKPFSCDQCGKRFSVKVNFKRHLDTHRITFKCHMCAEVFDKKESLISHKLKEHREEMNKCKERKQSHDCQDCKQTFQYKIDLLRHLKSAHGIDKPYQCEKCDSKFGDEHQLKKHFAHKHDEESAPLGDKPDMEGKREGVKKPHQFKCEICSKVLAGRGSYMNHRMTHEESRKFKCQYCPATYRWRVNLKAHERVHTEERPFVCNVPGCLKSFTTQAILKRHQITHDDEKKFKCNQCDKTFSYSLTLKRHIIATHDKEKTECDICHEKFAYSSNLWRHVKYTHSDKAFKCDTCDKKFAIKYDLKKHMTTHDATCTYKCPICPKTFKRSEFLTKHFQQHKGIPQHPCSKCKESFMTRSQRDRHTKTCQTGVLIQMNADVAQNFELQPEEVGGVKHLIVDPNLVQNVTNTQEGLSLVESTDLSVINQSIMAANIVTESSGSQQPGNSNDTAAQILEEDQQTIILLVNGDQDGGESVMIDRAMLQQQAGDPGTYQIIQTYVEGDQVPDMMPGNTLSIPEGYEVVLESNYPVTESQ